MQYCTNGTWSNLELDLSKNENDSQKSKKKFKNDFKNENLIFLSNPPVNQKLNASLLALVNLTFLRVQKLLLIQTHIEFFRSNKTLLSNYQTLSLFF